VEIIKKLFNDFDVYFLSAPMWHVPLSFAGKRIWIENHFGEMAKRKLILTQRKDLAMGDILIDDRLVNGAKDFKGEFILFGSAKFPDWAAIVKHLYELKIQ
jgi:5'-nucleotidase